MEKRRILTTYVTYWCQNVISILQFINIFIAFIFQFSKFWLTSMVSIINISSLFYNFVVYSLISECCTEEKFHLDIDQHFFVYFWIRKFILILCIYYLSANMRLDRLWLKFFLTNCTSTNQIYVPLFNNGLDSKTHLYLCSCISQ